MDSDARGIGYFGLDLAVGDDTHKGLKIKCVQLEKQQESLY